MGHRARARCGGRERWRWFLARAGTRPSTRAAPPGRGAAGSVAEVTESNDGVAVVQRASTRWRVRVCCRAAWHESDGYSGYSARRAELFILACFQPFNIFQRLGARGSTDKKTETVSAKEKKIWTIGKRKDYV